MGVVVIETHDGKENHVLSEEKIQKIMRDTTSNTASGVFSDLAETDGGKLYYNNYFIVWIDIVVNAGGGGGERNGWVVFCIFCTRFFIGANSSFVPLSLSLLPHNPQSLASKLSNNNLSTPPPRGQSQSPVPRTRFLPM